MQASALGRILHTAFLTSAGVSEAAKELTVSLSSSIEPGGDLQSSARQMPQNQKSRGDKSGLRGGQTLSVRLEIILFPNFSSNQSRTIFVVWSLAPFFIAGHATVCNISR